MHNLTGNSVNKIKGLKIKKNGKNKKIKILNA
jgi:hypothetical protein